MSQHNLTAVPVGNPVPVGVLPSEDIFGNTKKLRFVLESLECHAQHLGRPPVVLDFGCGNAAAAGQYLADGRRRYYGVDIHEPSLEHARRICTRENTFFGQEIPKGIAFDVLVYADVIEHLDDPYDVLQEHVRLLAPDGILVGSVPNGYGPCEMEKWISRKLRLFEVARTTYRTGKRLLGQPLPQKSYISYNSDSGHVQFFTLASLKALADRLGMKIRRFAHGGFVGADLTGSTIFASNRFVNWNVSVSDVLPSHVVSTWYFEMVQSNRPAS